MDGFTNWMPLTESEAMVYPFEFDVLINHNGSYLLEIKVTDIVGHEATDSQPILIDNTKVFLIQDNV